MVGRSEWWSARGWGDNCASSPTHPSVGSCESCGSTASDQKLHSSDLSVAASCTSSWPSHRVSLWTLVFICDALGIGKNTNHSKKIEMENLWKKRETLWKKYVKKKTFSKNFSKKKNPLEKKKLWKKKNRVKKIFFFEKKKSPCEKKLKKKKLLEKNKPLKKQLLKTFFVFFKKL